ncbi:unnamed protein product [Acanthoscelides obtectus]|uniref:Chromatin modification-related protein YNG2 n=1 Tax=Acanthoscelides obtectus TaxID=200917 RepID=A0A9P0Q1W7_ACAOB|nr:unnamed protein product [Acanthoscelides obtectus]CAK1626030.1 Chromatin modification-related protein YNG2 [Acanthoscelides obtectus]
MEDGPNSVLPAAEIASISRNGVVSPIMAKFPLGDNSTAIEDKVDRIDLTKINGDAISGDLFENDDSYDSESDALVIDESLPKKKKHQKKKPVIAVQSESIPEEPKLQKPDNPSHREVGADTFQEHEEGTTVNNSHEDTIHPEEIPDIITHSNPFFNESLFELSQQHHNSHEDVNNKTEIVDKNKHKSQKRIKTKQKPKLKEYAQYLGLQPNVQFKCSKCGKAGFESLATLHEHLVQCNAESVQETSSDNTKSGFKLTRKVFLCSACGTYYENWNLYMHMLEFHRRYICLYCLGMFSVLEDLCQHIQSRHNLEPGHRNSLDEFFSAYNEPCYVVCCECNKLFSEQDNFFYHSCAVKGGPKAKKPVRPQITPENHVTGESETVNKDVSKSSGAQKVSDIEKSEDTVKESMKDDIPMETEKNSNRLSTDVRNENEDSNANLGAADNVVDKMEPQYAKSENNKELDEAGPVSDYSIENSRDGVPDTLVSPEPVEEKDHSEEMEEKESSEDITETRKVPKLSLKLPKPGFYPEPDDSDDSEKLTMEVDQIESENEIDNDPNNISSGQEQYQSAEANHVQDAEPEEKKEENGDTENAVEVTEEPQLHVAGSEIPIIELELEQPLDKFDAKILLQKCLKMTVATCIYCNHARKIAVNGRQLALHCIAEHRFSAIVNSITAEELIPESFVNRLQECLDDLEKVFFNLDSNFSDEAVTFSHIFECFQCYFSTTVHKELYLHNRKFHSKNLLLCIMCKTNFYNYSELMCHLCPGLYILDYDLQFRCCMCVNDDLPSAFRLMVHLRKRHNVCDVCLEMCHTQYRLSNHVWKHKLHHFCYRCGIAYRNKPDITRHLFWKHGTESVLCKRCLQKKWPHVYHFCTPPASFTCDECQNVFSKAVSLKVHKRLHTEERKHACTFEECTEAFVSKKLMLKHEARHREPVEEVKPLEVEAVAEDVKQEEPEEKVAEEKEPENVEEKPKPKIDVLDLPALNLSESDSSDSETDEKDDEKLVEEKRETKEETASETAAIEPSSEQTVSEATEVPTESVIEEQPSEIEEKQEAEDSTSVIQDIWDNFKNYQASKEKLDNMFSTEEKAEKPPEEEIPIPMIDEEPTVQIALMDHDYCLEPEQKTDASLIEVKPALEMRESVDHDYCTAKAGGTVAEKPPPEPLPTELLQTEEKEKKDSSSSSSSDSDSCSCGSNCSCSSSSNSSSSSSDSSGSDSSTEEGRQKQQARRQKRRERAKKLKEKGKDKQHKDKENAESKVVDVVATFGGETAAAPVIAEPPINESDLETTESETDEEFYDRAPQKLAKKILEEKRQQLLALMGPNSVPTVPNGSFIESTSRPPTPPAGSVVEEQEERKHKKSKSKKRKKRKNERREQESRKVSVTNIITDVPIPPYYQQFHHQIQQQQQAEQQPPPTPSVPPLTLSLSRLSPAPTQQIHSPAALRLPHSPALTPLGATGAGTPHATPGTPLGPGYESVRASKRRRVPNKFYGYSSDEEEGGTPRGPKWRKTVAETAATPRSPLTVPPITIKAPPPPQPPPQPTVEPISIRTGAHLSDFHVRRPRPKKQKSRDTEDSDDDATDSDDGSDSDEERKRRQQQQQMAVAGAGGGQQVQPQLYCYCRCPYDEVSEMIGCDASDCAIEWFHFECVGIMVPPKGQWFCPDCRKKKQQRQLMQHSVH